MLANQPFYLPIRVPFTRISRMRETNGKRNFWNSFPCTSRLRETNEKEFVEFSFTCVSHMRETDVKRNCN